MTINYAILGLLSKEPMTGYDLKKIMQDSSYIYWSGNNNQIYKALLELSDQGYVTSEIRHQDSSPTKKLYTISSDGLSVLKKWAMDEPSPPDIKKPFLIQLAFSDQLTSEEIMELMDKYEHEIDVRIQAEEKLYENTKDRSSVRELIYDNIKSTYTNELDWIKKAKKYIAEKEKGPNRKANNQKGIEDKKMNYQVKEKNNIKYLLIGGEGKPVNSEQDAIDVISLCSENGTDKVLIEGTRLTDDFLRLSTRIAGGVLQKLAQYEIKTAAVLEESRTKGKFKEFLAESNSGKSFRAYDNYNEAESWLLSI